MSILSNKMVVCDFNKHPAIKDVIYVVEDTAALATNFDELLNNYLVKALEYFNGGSHSTVEKSWSSIECSSTFTLVLYKSATWRPDRLTVRRGPFSSAKKFFTSLEKIAFYGGEGETKSCASDGLANALHVFDELQSKRQNYLKAGHPISQYVILVANSPAYDMPVQDIPTYMGKHVDEILKKFTERKIFFSVIAPRKIPQLIRMYQITGGDLSKYKETNNPNFVNYAKDGTQLVLLNGFELERQPYVTKATQQKQARVLICIRQL